MHKTCKISSFWLRVLLGVSTFQACTPDTNNLASSRLFEVFGPIIERGDSWASSHLGCRWLAILIETSRPIPGSVPNEDDGKDLEPDEVCVPSALLACEPAQRKSADPHPLRLSAHDLPQLRVRSIRSFSPSCREPLRWTGGLIDSLFCLIC
ncbi:MAG TPA: hypothetical protein VKA15_14840 [Isosphaeraceae bacterium]|nr:hypothetical protein [Isosphaeraceae bacterium]